MAEAQSMIINKDNVKPFKTPQQKRQRTLAVIIFLVIAAFAAGGYFLLIPGEETYKLKSYESAVVVLENMIKTTQAGGTVEIPAQMSLVNPAMGYADTLYVSEGEQVVTGQVLAHLNVPDLEDSLFDVKADLDNSLLSYKKAVQQDLFSIQKTEREIVSLNEDIDDAIEERDKLLELVKVNASRQSDLDKSETALETLLDNKTEKEISLDEQKQINELELEIMQFNITNLETKAGRLEDQINDSYIKSPMNGEILEIASVLGVPGSQIKSSAALFTIADPSSVIVSLEVDEQYSGILENGQSVELTIGNRELTGEITSIGKVAQISSDGLNATIVVKVKPSTADDSLIQGATAVGLLELGVNENTLILPRGPYLTTGNQKYLYKVENGKAYKIKVTYGEYQGNDVEIINGVSEGDEIIVSGYQNFIEYEVIQIEQGE